jgi:hypothetical protein
MNDVDRLITEAMMAFNTKMASAGDRFTRLSEAQRYLLRAVERAEQYVEHGGSLEEITTPVTEIPVSEQPQPIEDHNERMPRYLRAATPPEPPERDDSFHWGQEFERALGAR